jgi:hypothetical protein
MKDELLKAIDSEAARSRVRRSALVQAAVRRYLEERKNEREASAIRREMDEACQGMNGLAEKLGRWDPVSVIRESRDSRFLRVREPRRRYHSDARKRRR